MIYNDQRSRCSVFVRSGAIVVFVLVVFSPRGISYCRRTPGIRVGVRVRVIVRHKTK